LVEDKLSDALLSGEFMEGDAILLVVDNEEITLKKQEKKPEPELMVEEI